jgi:glutaredoxin
MAKVLMYTLSTCPWCRKTRQYFTDNKVPFEFVDYDLASDEEQDRIVAHMRKYTDQISFPFVLIGEEIVQGWNPGMYEKLLKKPGGT